MMCGAGQKSFHRVKDGSKGFPAEASRRSVSRDNCSASWPLLRLSTGGGLKIGGRAEFGCDWLWRSRKLADVTIPFDGSHHALTVPRNPGIAYVARPRIDDVSHRIDRLGVSSVECNGVLTLKILLKGIIPRQRETTNNDGLTSYHSTKGTNFSHCHVPSSKPGHSNLSR